MATSTETLDVAQTTPAVKLPLLPLLLICLLAVFFAVAGCGGVVYYLAHTGRLGANASPPPTEKVVEAPPTHPVVVEPLLVNLADQDGHSYLRVGIVLAEAEDKKAAAEAKPTPGANASVRDTILDVLGRKSSAELLDVAGKEGLKKELKAALDAKVPEAKVQAVYFTDFLVQR
jgi:flagellar FliL protein